MVFQNVVGDMGEGTLRGVSEVLLGVFEHATDVVPKVQGILASRILAAGQKHHCARSIIALGA